jgi:hypothetical protein
MRHLHDTHAAVRQGLVRLHVAHCAAPNKQPSG